MKFSGSLVLSCAFLYCGWITSSHAGEAESAWEKEWNENIEAGRERR